MSTDLRTDANPYWLLLKDCEIPKPLSSLVAVRIPRPAAGLVPADMPVGLCYHSALAFFQENRRAFRKAGACPVLVHAGIVDLVIRAAIEAEPGAFARLSENTRRYAMLPVGHAIVSMPELGAVYCPTYETFFDRAVYYDRMEVREIAIFDQDAAGTNVKRYGHPGPWHRIWGAKTGIVEKAQLDHMIAQGICRIDLSTGILCYPPEKRALVRKTK